MALEERIAAAREEADRAACRAGVRVVPLDGPAEVLRIPPVVEAVWGPETRPTPDILRALAHAGAVLLAAEPTSGGETAGCALGFLGWAGGPHLHSHQVGVRPEWRHTGIGYALKLAQRVICLERGITEMRWTFDPLLARNAGFNFGKLGVTGVAFLPDFYGRMDDAINSGDASDRFEVSWRLDTELTPRITEGTGEDLLTTDAAGYPKRTEAPAEAGNRAPIPADYAELRVAGDPVAGAWRQAARGVFQECFDAGLIAGSFGPRGYVFDEELG